MSQKSRRRAQQARERAVKEALKTAQIEARGYNYCQRCGRSDKPLELSHNENKGAGGTSELITIEDAELLCNLCHGNEMHNLRLKESEPMWSMRENK